jgi:hypothetical protein
MNSLRNKHQGVRVPNAFEIRCAQKDESII